MAKKVGEEESCILIVRRFWMTDAGSPDFIVQTQACGRDLPVLYIAFKAATDSEGKGVLYTGIPEKISILPPSKKASGSKAFLTLLAVAGCTCSVERKQYSSCSEALMFVLE